MVHKPWIPLPTNNPPMTHIWPSDSTRTTKIWGLQQAFNLGFTIRLNHISKWVIAHSHCIADKVWKKFGPVQTVDKAWIPGTTRGPPMAHPKPIHGPSTACPMAHLLPNHVSVKAQAWPTHVYHSIHGKDKCWTNARHMSYLFPHDSHKTISGHTAWTWTNGGQTLDSNGPPMMNAIKPNFRGKARF